MAEKLIIPKHLDGVDYFYYALKVYDDNPAGIEMAPFTDALYAYLKNAGIASEQKRNRDNTHYTKCAQLPRYFGFVEYMTDKEGGPARITSSGRNILWAIEHDDKGKIRKAFIDAITSLSFGRNNQGCGSSSDCEPFGIFFKALFALGGVSKKEFGYIAAGMDAEKKSFDQLLSEVVSCRDKGIPVPVTSGSFASVLADCKPMGLLRNYDVLASGEKGLLVLSPNLQQEDVEKLNGLSLYNSLPMKALFKQWLRDQGYSDSAGYLRSVEAISLPLSVPMVKNTAAWEGVYEYVLGEAPQVGVFSVTGRKDFDEKYSRFSRILVKGLRPPVAGIDPVRHQELIEYTLMNTNSLDKGRLYTAYGVYKEFLDWFELNKNNLGFPTKEVCPMRNQILSAIRTKPFILLAGISGTGKSRMVRQLARGFCPTDGPLADEKKPGNFEMIQVRPNWHDSSELLGYVSRISGKPEFVIKPFVEFLVKAWLYPEVPFFLCLDEMNLAPVEQYFAEYLSVVETRQFLDGKIVTDPIVEFEEDVYEAAIKKLMEPHVWITQAEDTTRKAAFDAFMAQVENDHAIGIPPNLVVMGTVNMDETTFSFSRKVLDRAMSFELNEVNLLDGLEKSTKTTLGEFDHDGSALQHYIEADEVYSEHKDLCDKVIAYLGKVNEVLDKTPFKVAYRTRNEMMIYCVERCSAGGVSLAQALDEVTSMKILSRVEGDRRRLALAPEDRTRLGLSEKAENLLVALEERIMAELKVANDGKDLEDSVKICKEKLHEMTKQLNGGYTSFWSR